MTNITKAAQDALAELADWHWSQAATLRKAACTSAMDKPEPVQSSLTRMADWHDAQKSLIRAALQDKAGEVTVAIDSLYNERRDGMTNAIFPPVQIGARLFAAQPAPVVPDDHPLMIFARECELGTYMEHEVPLAARKAVAASQKKG